MKENFLKLFPIFFVASILALSSCTQSPNLSLDVGGEPPPNAATPPGERPVITSDSGPQGVWHCKEYIVDHPEKYKIEEIPEDCRAYILPNAKDFINPQKQAAEIPQRIIPTIEGPAENTNQMILIIPQYNTSEALRHSWDINFDLDEKEKEPQF